MVGWWSGFECVPIWSYRCLFVADGLISWVGFLLSSERTTTVLFSFVPMLMSTTFKCLILSRYKTSKLLVLYLVHTFSKSTLVGSHQQRAAPYSQLQVLTLQTKSRPNLFLSLEARSSSARRMILPFAKPGVYWPSLLSADC